MSTKHDKPPVLIDKDGFPPCTMTAKELCAHILETFGHHKCRIVAFRIRGYSPGGTLTTKRGVMTFDRANKAQVAAVTEAIKKTP